MVKKSAKTSLLIMSMVAILFCVFGCSEEQSDIAANTELINTDNIRLREELDQCREKNKQLEGVVGQVPSKGPLADSVFQLIGGIKAGIGICGAKDIQTLKKTARFIRITSAGVHEGHPHDITITKEAPNYRALS